MMASEFEQNLEKYAEVAVKVGLNLQPGQRLLIGTPMMDGLTPIEAAPLVRLIAARAYRVGARLVDVMWGDDQLKPIIPLPGAAADTRAVSIHPVAAAHRLIPIVPDQTAARC
jgi:leucyl aminopeptidase (aminopeptidase T)